MNRIDAYKYKFILSTKIILRRHFQKKKLNINKEQISILRLMLRCYANRKLISTVINSSILLLECTIDHVLLFKSTIFIVFMSIISVPILRHTN